MPAVTTSSWSFLMPVAASSPPSTGAKVAATRSRSRALHAFGPDLSCPGIGPLAGTRIRIAGLFGQRTPRHYRRWLGHLRRGTRVAQGAHPAFERRRYLSRFSGGGPVAHLPLRLLGAASCRFLSFGTHSGCRHQQRYHALAPGWGRVGGGEWSGRFEDDHGAVTPRPFKRRILLQARHLNGAPPST